MPEFDAQTLIYLRAMRDQFPTAEAALAAIAGLRATLTLPKGTIHVISDVHGEYVKLKHVINNASGSLRPLIDQTFEARLSDAEKLRLANLIYYPRETFMQMKFAGDLERRDFVRQTCAREFELLRVLSRRYDMVTMERVFPASFRAAFRELLYGVYLERSPAYFEALLDPILQHRSELDFLRMIARVIRNLLISELIVAGDFGDRGPRIDRVIDTVMHQPNVSITWGNHDASWLGACLGSDACIATVLRFSLRYRRLSQLEEGYGIPLAPLERLARTVYADDPAAQFACKGEGLRDPLQMARMQKAIAIILFKLEGQLIERNPQFHLSHRNLLPCIDGKAGTITLDGHTHPLVDTKLPTIDWSNPNALSEEETTCIRRLRRSFLQSPVLWQQMRYMTQKGTMWLRRDDNLIFHGCVPVDAQGEFLPMEIDGRELRGRALFDELNLVVQRAVRTNDPQCLDLLWYLWSGPLSPLFGKDKMAALEGYFIADKHTHHETKNPYFELIHEPWFCEKVLAEFGCDPKHGLIVNGHVPVKMEKGESPLKRSGLAVTIDGAFSEAYGDKGYTLVLDAERTSLALHHHFESVSDAIHDGADIIPSIEYIRVFKQPRTVADTESGERLRNEIVALEKLIAAYERNIIPEGG
jgi:fructose-1,6-bisphosphatase III